MILSFILGILGGLLSGLSVYWLRQEIQADRLRTAISMEVRNTPLDALSTAFKGEAALQTPIIDANLDKIYLLTEDEIVEVENFHRHMRHVRDQYEIRTEDGEDKIHIPTKLQRDGVRYARATAHELEGNILGRQIGNTVFDSGTGLLG